MTGIRQALGFLTVFGGSQAPSPAAIVWFPLIGIGIGAALGVIWWGAGRLWPPLLAAVVVVIADLVLTGLLHADGLLDAGDGLLAPLDRERRLAVMADPHAGAFGVVTLVVVVALRIAALAALVPSVWLMAALWGASRVVMAVATVTVPYARAEIGGGLASAFLGTRARPVAALWLAPVAVSAAVWHVPMGLLALGAALAGGVGVVRFARRRIGGFTGDVLGAAGMVAETVGLVVAAARW